MDKLELAYNDVFTKDGSVKACGRPLSGFVSPWTQPALMEMQKMAL